MEPRNLKVRDQRQPWIDDALCSVAAAAIGGAALVGGSAISSSASKKASKAATNAANQNNALERDIYDSNKEILSPYVNRGNLAGDAQTRALGLTGSADPYGGFLASPDYQFRLDEGNRALTGNYAARGLLGSGSFAQGVLNYGQHAASQEFAGWFDRLSGLSGQGLSGAGALAGAGQNYAGAVSNNNNSAASAVGNAALTNAANINGLLGSAAGAYGLYKGGMLGGGGYGSGFGAGSAGGTPSPPGSWNMRA